MQATPWSSLDIAKLCASVLTPISVAVLGLFISRKMKMFEHIQWSNQKLIEKRLFLYDELAPLLNRLFCIYTWVGYWKDITPNGVIETKRELDKKLTFIATCWTSIFIASTSPLFMHYSQPTPGPVTTRRFAQKSRGANGDRTKDCNYTWDTKWNVFFQEDSGLLGKHQIHLSYDALMSALSNSIGLPSKNR